MSVYPPDSKICAAEDSLAFQHAQLSHDFSLDFMTAHASAQSAMQSVSAQSLHPFDMTPQYASNTEPTPPSLPASHGHTPPSFSPPMEGNPGGAQMMPSFGNGAFSMQGAYDSVMNAMNGAPSSAHPSPPVSAPPMGTSDGLAQQMAFGSSNASLGIEPALTHAEALPLQSTPIIPAHPNFMGVPHAPETLHSVFPTDSAGMLSIKREDVAAHLASGMSSIAPIAQLESVRSSPQNSDTSSSHTDRAAVLHGLSKLIDQAASARDAVARCDHVDDGVKTRIDVLAGLVSRVQESMSGLSLRDSPPASYGALESSPPLMQGNGMSLSQSDMTGILPQAINGAGSRKRPAISTLDEEPHMKQLKHEPAEELTMPFVPSQSLDKSNIFPNPLSVQPLPVQTNSLPLHSPPISSSSGSSYFDPQYGSHPSSTGAPEMPSHLQQPHAQPLSYDPSFNKMPSFTRTTSDLSHTMTRHQHSLSAGSRSNLSGLSLSGPPTLSMESAHPQRIGHFSNLAMADHPPLPPQPLMTRMHRSGSLGSAYPPPTYGNYDFRPHDNVMSTLHSSAMSQPPLVPDHVNGYMSAQPTMSHWPDNRGQPNFIGVALPGGTVDEEDEDEGDDDDNERPQTSHSTAAFDGAYLSASGSDVPQEYRADVDRIFFEFLNKICSNLLATDAKGESIHQTLMAKKMARLDESPDFRPFKFRIQAFTNAFLEELARQGFPEEKIPMKKVRNYLWRQQYILRFNEDGKKAKSKGNHIWNVEAKKSGECRWEFRPFHRKIAGSPPGVAYIGLHWEWTPRIWDPQASWQNVPVHYSSPSLPFWLSWKNDVLSGTPPQGAESCDITTYAKFVLDGQEGILSHTFHLNIAPAMPTVSSAFTSPARPVAEFSRRTQSDSVLPTSQSHRVVVPMSGIAVVDELALVKQVLVEATKSVTEKKDALQAETSVMHLSPSDPKQSEINSLVDQKRVLETLTSMTDRQLCGEGSDLAAGAKDLVVQGAHVVHVQDSIASGLVPSPPPADTSVVQCVSVTKMANMTEGAIAESVNRGVGTTSILDIVRHAIGFARMLGGRAGRPFMTER